MDTFNEENQQKTPDYGFLQVLEREKGTLSQQQRLEAIRAPLLSWYRKNARDLPWRKDSNAYRVWISEIMLQQTRVEAVKPYFQRFMEAFPDAAALAAAEDDHLLKLWEGLGYYSRARNLKKAAVQIVEQYGGSLPDSYEALLKLPGIGSYTAGAIASIDFGIPVPAVDGNVLRVISRLLGSRMDTAEGKTKKYFQGILKEAMDQNEPGIYNQALFEVGALVCIPRGAPKCQECPMASVCIASSQDLWKEIPVKTSKKSRRVEERTVLVIRSGTQVALRKRPDKGLLASLYEFPNEEGWLSDCSLKDAAEAVGVAEDKVEKVVPLGEARHVFSHVEWHMTGYYIQLKGGIPPAYLGVEKKELEGRYPVPSAFLAYKKALSAL